MHARVMGHSKIHKTEISSNPPAQRCHTNQLLLYIFIQLFTAYFPFLKPGDYNHFQKPYIQHFGWQSH